MERVEGTAGIGSTFGLCGHCGAFGPLYLSRLYVGGIGYVWRSYCVADVECARRADQAASQAEPARGVAAP